MSLISRCQKQVLVYWPRVGTQKTGESIFGPPVEYTCRWEEMLKEVQTGTATRVVSRVQAITQVRLQVGGLMRLGTLIDTSFWDYPKSNPDVYEVIDSSATPNLRNTETLYEACG